MSIADELITRGWTQGRPIDSKGRVCLYAAALLSRGEEVTSHTLAFIETNGRYPEVHLAIRGAIREVASSVKWSNDDEDTTYDEVLRVAKVADEILEGS